MSGILWYEPYLSKNISFNVCPCALTSRSTPSVENSIPVCLIASRRVGVKIGSGYVLGIA